MGIGIDKATNAAALIMNAKT